MADCENCEFSETDDGLVFICWYDPANPKKVTQPDANCDYEKAQE